MPGAFDAASFDPLSFDTALNPVVFGIPGLSRGLGTRNFLTLELGRMQFSPLGSAIVITLEVRDPSQKPPVLANPTSTPTLNVWNPDGTLLVTAGTFTNISTGNFTYTLQLASNGQKGPYEVQATAVSGGVTTLSSRDVGFTAG